MSIYFHFVSFTDSGATRYLSTALDQLRDSYRIEGHGTTIVRPSSAPAPGSNKDSGRFLGHADQYVTIRPDGGEITSLEHITGKPLAVPWHAMADHVHLMLGVLPFTVYFDAKNQPVRQSACMFRKPPNKNMFLMKASPYELVVECDGKKHSFGLA